MHMVRFWYSFVQWFYWGSVSKPQPHSRVLSLAVRKVESRPGRSHQVIRAAIDVTANFTRIDYVRSAPVVRTHADIYDHGRRQSLEVNTPVAYESSEL